MYPVSNAVKTLLESEQPQLLKITGTDANGVAISITDANVMTGSFSVDRFSCNGNKLEIGTAIASELTVKLDNANGAFDSVKFEGSELYVEIGVVTGPLTTYWIPCGYFIVDEQPRTRNTITLKAMDRMVMTDFALPLLNPWTDNNGNYITDNNGNVLFFDSYLAFPCTVSDLIDQICTVSGLTLGTDITGYPNVSYTITSQPAVPAGTTLRDYLQWAAALMGTCAYIDWRGYLCFGWYTSANYTSTPANRFNSDLYENDLTFTGVTYTDDSNVLYLAGAMGYTLDLSTNRLIGSNISSVLTEINTAINGFTYRPFSATAMPAPYLFPLDLITFTDADGVNHNCAVTNVNLTINNPTALKGKGETEKTNSYQRPSSMTAEQATAIQNSVDRLNNSLTQQEIFDRLTDGGLTQGISLEEVLTPALGASTPKRIFLNVDYVNEGEMAFSRLRGDVLTLGGANNVNGVLRILDADGNVIVEGSFNGMTINGGSFSSKTLSENSKMALDTGALQFYRLENGEYVSVFELSVDESESMGVRMQVLKDALITDIRNSSGLSFRVFPDENTDDTYSLINMRDDNVLLNLIKNGSSIASFGIEEVNGVGKISLGDGQYLYNGATGSFTANGHTLTIVNGIITDIT